MEVEHEGAERAFETGERALEDDEAGAGDLAGGFEIHQAEGLAQFEVLLWLEVEGGRFADGAHQLVVVLVGADGHLVERYVGQAGEKGLDLLVDAAFFLLALLDPGLEVGDLRLEPVGRRQILGAHGLADFLGGGVAAGLVLLQAGEVGTAFIVEREDGLGLRRETAALEALVEGVRVFADPFDVEHIGPFRRCGRARRGGLRPSSFR